MSKLFLDLGNSSVEALLLTSGKPRFFSDKTENIELFLSQFSAKKLDAVYVSSVVPAADGVIEEFFGFPVHFLRHDTVPYLKINLKIPEQVGADRLANALAAYHLYQRDVLVVDSGTATTFCVVSAKGVYQGGAIFPGMGICSKALRLYTAKIPLIQVHPIKAMLGKTTKEAVQVGLFHGFTHMINGMIASYRRENPGIYVIGTGNGLKILEKNLMLDVFVPNLVLKGLAVFSEVISHRRVSSVRRPMRAKKNDTRHSE